MTVFASTPTTELKRALKARKETRAERDLTRRKSALYREQKTGADADCEIGLVRLGEAEVKYADGDGPEPEALRDRCVEDDRNVRALGARADAAKRKEDALTAEVAALKAPLGRAKVEYLGAERQENTRDALKLINEFIERFRPIAARAWAIKNDTITRWISDTEIPIPGTGGRNALHTLRSARSMDSEMQQMMHEYGKLLRAIDAELSED